MKITLLSDIHLEFNTESDEFRSPDLHGDILVLAGDIGSANKGRGLAVLKSFLERICPNFQKVFYVAGNHEFYGGVMNDVKNNLAEVAEGIPNLEFMDMKSVLYEGVRFLGTTLWSKIPPEKASAVEMTLNDYRQIKFKRFQPITAAQTNAIFEKEHKWLKGEIEKANEANEKIVVITHHAPLTHGTFAGKYEGKASNAAFVSDLSQTFAGKVHYFFFGHTHYSCHIEYQGEAKNGTNFVTHVISNQRGYYFEKETGWKDEMVIEID